MNEHILGAETWTYGRILHGVGAMLAISVAVFGYTCVYAPMVKGTDESRVEIERLTDALREAPAVQKEHKQLRERLVDVTNRIKQLRSRVPEDDMVSQFVSQVTKVAEKEGVALSNIDPGQPVGREGFMECEIEFIGSGSYESFCQFVDRVRKLPRLSKVTGLEVHSEAMGQETYPVKLRTAIYYGLDAGALKQDEEPSNG